jgi:2-polyprenyl-3-methyl-5-hydroxy-6-metoxy-1,4-benzoquinol methylase
MKKLLSPKIRKVLARLLPGRFPGLYSTLDDPQRVPVQEAAYRLAAQRYLQPGDRVLDVGFGLGYGLEMMSGQGRELWGIDIDQAAVEHGQALRERIPGLQAVQRYDGLRIPFEDRFFQVVTCVDVLEHVPDYLGLLKELVRVSQRVALISTPNWRPENTRPDGKPRNIWHLREWNYTELDAILRQLEHVQVEWNLLDGPWQGPIWESAAPSPQTQALAPALLRKAERS